MDGSEYEGCGECSSRWLLEQYQRSPSAHSIADHEPFQRSSLLIFWLPQPAQDVSGVLWAVPCLVRARHILPKSDHRWQAYGSAWSRIRPKLKRRKGDGRGSGRRPSSSRGRV
jgi:hypothetical protein